MVTRKGDAFTACLFDSKACELLDNLHNPMRREIDLLLRREASPAKADG
jgi:hypothetical protein